MFFCDTLVHMFKEKIATFKGDMNHYWETHKQSKVSWVVVIAAVIIVALVVAKGSSDAPTSTVTATVGTVVDSVTLSGRTASASAVELGFADQGRVARVSVTEGDKVTKGELLASIDTSDLYLANITKLTREQNALVANSYRTLLSSGLQVIPENINDGIIAATVSGVYTGPEGEYRIRIYSSSSGLGKSFEVSGLENGDIQPVTTDTAVPLGSRGLYIQFAALPSNGTWIISIPNKRSPLYASYLNAYESAQATRDRVIADAQASNESVLSRMNKRKIFAPFSGTVARVGIKAGESTGSLSAEGTTSGTITLISENDYEVTLKAPEISVAKLRVGQDVAITLDAYGKDVVFPGKITSINPAETIVDGVPVYETKVSFINRDERIRSGMTATATIVVAQKENVVMVPVYVVTANEDGVASVMIDTGDGASEQRVVTLGLRGVNSFVEITSGLSGGEFIKAESKK